MDSLIDGNQVKYKVQSEREILRSNKEGKKESKYEKVKVTKKIPKDLEFVRVM